MKPFRVMFVLFQFCRLEADSHQQRLAYFPNQQMEYTFVQYMLLCDYHISIFENMNVRHISQAFSWTHTTRRFKCNIHSRDSFVQCKQFSSDSPYFLKR